MLVIIAAIVPQSMKNARSLLKTSCAKIIMGSAPKIVVSDEDSMLLKRERVASFGGFSFDSFRM